MMIRSFHSIDPFFLLSCCFAFKGHGGNGFLKFQDSEEITSFELADALEQMWQKGRLVRILNGQFLKEPNIL